MMANQSELTLDSIAAAVFDALAEQFPVCLASDEFHYFPQAVSSERDWSYWDDFSPEAIESISNKMITWEITLSWLHSSHPAQQVLFDIAMLRRVLNTLREQFQLVRFQETQPTFYLTIAAIGLAEALENSAQAWQQRIETLPAFLEQIHTNLRDVPHLFCHLGREMIQKIKLWLQSLQTSHIGTAAAIDALNHLDEVLKALVTTEEILVPLEVYARIAQDHIGCQMSLENISRRLDEEIEETRDMLQSEASRLLPGNSWQQVLKRFPRPTLPPDGPLGLYHSIISELGQHCHSANLAPDDLMKTCPVSVAPVPDYLLPIRSAAAYSMPPRHPPSGGTFFIMTSQSFSDVPRDVWLLSAHETYPGHHLLDAMRWCHTRPVRRHIEFPLFYEGWASFAEELLFDTGFFSGTRDKFLMAKRRFWRAVRGKVDLELHTRRRNFDQATNYLVTTGLQKEQAQHMLKRYTLKPGYQLCYSIGRYHFRRMYDQFIDSGRTPAEFARKTLTQGEIELGHLQQTLYR